MSKCWLQFWKTGGTRALRNVTGEMMGASRLSSRVPIPTGAHICSEVSVCLRLCFLTWDPTPQCACKHQTRSFTAAPPTLKGVLVCIKKKKKKRAPGWVLFSVFLMWNCIITYAFQATISPEILILSFATWVRVPWVRTTWAGSIWVFFPTIQPKTLEQDLWSWTDVGLYLRPMTC